MASYIWLIVVAGLLYAIYRFYRKYRNKKHIHLTMGNYFLDIRADPSTSSTQIAEKLRKQYPLHTYPSDFTYVDQEKELIKVQQEVMNGSIIGIDIENDSLHSYFGCICLIQISTIYHNYVIDVVKLRNSMKSFLKPILENPGIIKVLFDANSDSLWIQRDFDLVLVNVCDLKAFTDGQSSLCNLWSKYCDFHMEKEKKEKFQMSDWYTRPLSKEQIEYSYLDSFFLLNLRAKMISELIVDNRDACIEKLVGMQTIQSGIKYDESIVYHKFRAKVNKNDKALYTYILVITDIREKACKAYNRPSKSILSDQDVINIAQKIIDNQISKEDVSMLCKCDSFFGNILTERIFNVAKRPLVDIMIEFKNVKLELIDNKTKQWLEQSENQKKKQQRKDLLIQKYSTQNEIYEHCGIEAPDGELLCYCDRRKADWYIKKKLAEVKTFTPFIVKLKFEPNGRKNRTEEDIRGDAYYTCTKQNICVVCGSTSNLIRYHIVPIQYRRHFPNELKSHRCHDVLLLCFNCQENANKVYDIQKKEVLGQYNIQLEHSKEDLMLLKKINKMKTIANKLLKEEAKLNKIAKEGLYNNMLRLYKANTHLFDQYPVDYAECVINNNIKISFIKFISQCEAPNLSEIDVGKLVVDKIIDYEEFVQQWRKYFLKAMAPKFMPNGWEVDHRIARSFGKLSAFK